MVVELFLFELHPNLLLSKFVIHTIVFTDTAHTEIRKISLYPRAGCVNTRVTCIHLMHLGHVLCSRWFGIVYIMGASCLCLNSEDKSTFRSSSC